MRAKQSNEVICILFCSFAEMGFSAPLTIHVMHRALSWPISHIKDGKRIKMCAFVCVCVFIFRTIRKLDTTNIRVTTLVWSGERSGFSNHFNFHQCERDFPFYESRWNARSATVHTRVPKQNDVWQYYSRSIQKCKLL